MLEEVSITAARRPAFAAERSQAGRGAASSVGSQTDRRGESAFFSRIFAFSPITFRLWQKYELGVKNREQISSKNYRIA